MNVGKIMNIVTSADKNFIRYTKVMLYSLFKHNHDKIHVYMYYRGDDMSEELQNIKKMAETFGNIVYFKKAEQEVLGIGSHWGGAVWDRWLCIEDLKETCDRALMLSGDVLVRKDISEYYNQDFKDKLLIMVDDSKSQLGRYEYISEKFKIRKSDCKTDGCPCMCLINLKEAHKVLRLEKLMELQAHYQFNGVEQAVLNYCYTDYIEISKIATCVAPAYEEELLTFEQLEKELEEDYFIHFNGSEKPWKVYRGRHSEDIWISYAKEVLKDIDWEKFKREKLPRASYELKQDRVKFRKNYDLLSHLCHNIFFDKTLEEWFERNQIRRVAVFGTGNIGQSFYGYFKDKFNTCYFATSEKKEEYLEVPVYTIEELEHEGNIDLVILTLGYGTADIKAKFSALQSKVYSLDELLWRSEEAEL